MYSKRGFEGLKNCITEIKWKLLDQIYGLCFVLSAMFSQGFIVSLMLLQTREYVREQ